MGRQKVVAIIYIVSSPCNRTEGNSKSTIFIYPTPLGQLFKFPPFSAKKSHSEGGRGGSPDNFFSGILLFLLLRIACKIPNTYDKPFCQLHEDDFFKFITITDRPRKSKVLAYAGKFS